MNYTVLKRRPTCPIRGLRLRRRTPLPMRMHCTMHGHYRSHSWRRIMRSTVIAIALAAAGLAILPAVSRADDASGTNGGFFVNGNIGRSNLDKGPYDDNDTGYAGNIGYRWALNPNVALGVEGGYT